MNNEFKIPERFLIKYDELNINYRVFSTINGWGTVTKLGTTSYSEYPIRVDFDNGFTETYDKIGRSVSEYYFPSIFKSNPFSELSELPIPRMVEVPISHAPDTKWTPRRLLADISKFNVPNPFICEVAEGGDACIYRKIREITPEKAQPLKEVTLEDALKIIAKEYGTDAKNIRLKE